MKTTKRFGTQQSVNQAIKNICDVMRRSKCAGAMQYVPELTWMLFLRILDEQETEEAEQAKAVRQDYVPSVESPYRWSDWADPNGAVRQKLQNGHLGDTFSFLSERLFPYLKGLNDVPNATPRQKVIAQIMDGIQQTRIDTEHNFLDVIDRVHEISSASIDTTHVFPLSQVYEGLLLKMGEKGNDGGQFFTPREVIRAMVQTVQPRLGEVVYDPCCGTGGFLAQAYVYMHDHAPRATPERIDFLKQQSFFGREKEDMIFPIALANLILHGIDQPNLWHGNSLTGNATYDELWQGAPPLFDVILTNPPFGGKENKDAQTNFAYRTSATQVLFLQHIISNLKQGGRCGMVVDEGIMFRTNEQAFVQTKRKLLDDCDLWCVVSLPAGAFVAAGAGVKTNLLFFTKGKPTEKTWYYDLSSVKVGKKSPLTLASFEEYLRLLPDRADSDHSWTVTRAEIEAKGYDIKAVNPRAKVNVDMRTPAELLDLIEQKGKEVDEAIKKLRETLR
jgi:type I restriction enzyme M protein